MIAPGAHAPRARRGLRLTTEGLWHPNKSFPGRNLSIASTEDLNFKISTEARRNSGRKISERRNILDLIRKGGLKGQGHSKVLHVGLQGAGQPNKNRVFSNGQGQKINLGASVNGLSNPKFMAAQWKKGTNRGTGLAQWEPSSGGTSVKAGMPKQRYRPTQMKRGVRGYGPAHWVPKTRHTSAKGLAPTTKPPLNSRSNIFLGISSNPSSSSAVPEAVSSQRDLMIIDTATRDHSDVHRRMEISTERGH
ncbi:hypothetical protein F0562_012409 [Nyssa sinensis]|uniref:Uncharacterized protein n=1 Tax=Nyssa sinensis TaxID=561372 RepID=A0A5J4ZVF5_9ASTE|nr:hypothetical protein F0562_012409 [Nyssa sinensis]